MNCIRRWTTILVLLICAIALANPLSAHAQVARYCSQFTVPYGATLPALGSGVYSTQAECEGYFKLHCTPDGAIVGQGGYCCNTTGTYYLKGNNVYCGKSAVVATTCTVGGNKINPGQTACGTNGDTFEYVCVATGNAVGSAVDDTGVATLQKRTCNSGWTCQGNACVAQNFSTCTLPHGTLDARANMFCCNGKYSATSCTGAQGYYVGGADLADGTWCTPGDSNLFSGSGGCGRCASKTATQRTDGKYYCGTAPRVYCNKICPANSFCNADANGGVCKTSSLSASPGPTPNLQVDLMYGGPKSSITTGQACNDANGCTCSSQSSLTTPITTVKKGDVCGGASLPAGSAVCSGQCVSGNSCSVAGEQKGIGVCTSGFVCCGTMLQSPGLTTAQSACIRNYNQTGLITQDGTCGQTLVSKGIVTQTQLNQTAAQQVIADIGLKAIVAQLDSAATAFERSQIMAKAYSEGKITLAEYTAATAYYATSTTMNVLTGGAETRFQNSVAYSKQQCALKGPSLDCTTAAIGAAANGLIATAGTAAAVDQLIGAPLTNTFANAIPNSATAATDTANAAQNAAIKQVIGSGNGTIVVQNGTVYVSPDVAQQLLANGNVNLGTGYFLDNGIDAADATLVKINYRLTSVRTDPKMFSNSLTDAIAGANVPSPNNTLTVVAHGNDSLIGISDAQGMVGLKPTTFANTLQQGGLVDNCTINLVSCLTGTPGGFADQLGQAMADLGYQNVTINAPVGTTNVDKLGRIIIYAADDVTALPSGQGWRTIIVGPDGIIIP